MKILIIFALVVVLFNESYCAPVGDDDGYYRESHSFNRWGRHYGGDLNLGVHAGFKDGMASLGTDNHFDFGADGYDGDDTREIRYAIPAQRPPSYSSNRYGSASSSPYSEYAPQYGQQFSPRFNQQYSPQPGSEQQYGSQYPQRTPSRRPSSSRGPPPDSPDSHQRREYAYE
ncbi:unnamed protein product [Spodoptera exigua]|nr:unnamed protein product [Spodoptera exigua]